MRLHMEFNYTNFHKNSDEDDLPLKDEKNNYVGKVEIMETLEQHISSILSMMRRGDNLSISIQVTPGEEK